METAAAPPGIVAAGAHGCGPEGADRVQLDTSLRRKPVDAVRPARVQDELAFVVPFATVGFAVMTRVKKSAPSLEVRNVKTETPLGFTWEEALEMLEQGYACEHVAKRTGFPVKMLECELKYL